MLKKCSKCEKEYEDDKKQSSMCPECRSAMGRRSKRKGASNERRFSMYLNEQFKKYGLPYIAKRTPRSGGIKDFESSDMMFRFVPGESLFSKIHFENKDTAQWDIQGWYDYALEKENESGKYRTPVIIARKPNGRDEFAIMNMEFLIKILIENELLKQNE